METIEDYCRLMELVEAYWILLNHELLFCSFLIMSSNHAVDTCVQTIKLNYNMLTMGPQGTVNLQSTSERNTSMHAIIHMLTMKD